MSLDNTPPQNPAISINGGTSATNSVTVNLSLSVTDICGVTAYYISESDTTPSILDDGWEAITANDKKSYQATVSYTLSSGDGPKIVYVWFRDGAGNISAKKSYSITLDTSGSPPESPTGVTATAGDGQITISWNEVSGAISYHIYWSTTQDVTKANGTKIPNVTSPYVHSGLIDVRI